MHLLSKNILKEIYNAIEYNLKRENSEPEDGEILYEIARLYALYGKVEDCRRALKRAVEKGFISYTFMKKDTFFNSVMDDENIRIILNCQK